jgi:AcrR family transcriptional regulator
MNNRSSRADGEATRERVMWTALKLFSERGIDAVSTRDIVAAAGARVNAAAIHYHFGSKGNLVRELIRSCFEAMSALESQSFERLDEEVDPTPRQVVIALVRPMQQLAADKRGRQMVGFLLETWRHPDYMVLHQSYEEPMERRRLAAIQRSVPRLPLKKQIVWAIVVSGIAARFIANREIDTLAKALAPAGVDIDVEQAVMDFLTSALTEPGESRPVRSRGTRVSAP